MSVAETLNAAADLLETKGWTQEAYALDADGRPCSELRDDAARYCMAGAMGVAAHALDSMTTVEDAHRCVELYVGASVESFNDAPGRTAAECISALRAAAQQAELSP